MEKLQKFYEAVQDIIAEAEDKKFISEDGAIILHRWVNEEWEKISNE